MLNAEQVRDYCIRKKGTEESFPFGPETLVFKVGGRIFLLLALDATTLQFNVKCDPQKAIELREKYHYIAPGFHMNKQHWNTITCTPGASSKLLLSCIDDSYNLVVASLPARLRNAL